jgi:hypothetical protein
MPSPNRHASKKVIGEQALVIDRGFRSHDRQIM